MRPARSGSAPVAESPAPEGRDPRAIELAMERICFDEWRIEQQAVALGDKDRAIQEQRQELASLGQRALRDSRRIAELEAELSRARTELVTLGDRSTYSGEICAELEQRLSELQGRVLEAEASRDRESARNRELNAGLERARERCVHLEQARERFFARLVLWQRQSATGNPHQVDLAEFISELRAEIGSLSAENQKLQQRIEAPRERPRRAGEEPDASPLLRVPSAPAGAQPASARTPAPRPAARLQDRPPAEIDLGPPPAATSPDPEPARPPQPAAAAEPRAEREPGASEAARESDASHSALRPDVPLAIQRPELETALLAQFSAEPKRRYVRRLLAELFGGGGVLRRRAAVALVEVAGAGAAPALIAALRHVEREDERAELVAQIGASGHRGALPVVDSYRRTGSATLRATALESAVRLLHGNASAQEAALRAALEDEDPRVRRRAVVAAAGCRGIDRGELIAPLLRDTDPQIRRVACAALAGDPRPAAARALLAALLDEDAKVRSAAARLLEPRLGRSLSALASWPEIDRRRAISALRKRLLRDPDRGRWIDAEPLDADPAREARAPRTAKASRTDPSGTASKEAPWRS